MSVPEALTRTLLLPYEVGVGRRCRGLLDIPVLPGKMFWIKGGEERGRGQVPPPKKEKKIKLEPDGTAKKPKRHRVTDETGSPFPPST